MTDRGVAYEFWLAVERARAAKPWTKYELSERTGIARTTIDNLRKSTRAPQARIVNTLASALGIDEREALELAGITPKTTKPGQSLRDVIADWPGYTPQQKQTLIHMVDTFERQNVQSLPLRLPEG